MINTNSQGNKTENEIYTVLLKDGTISEVPENQGSLAEFNEIMRETPEWAEGLPIDAVGYESKRYRK